MKAWEVQCLEMKPKHTLGKEGRLRDYVLGNRAAALLGRVEEKGHLLMLDLKFVWLSKCPMGLENVFWVK